MADDTEGLPAPKSSEDLIREARRSLGAGPAFGARASEDLMAAARDWLATGQPTAAEPQMEERPSRTYDEGELALAEAEITFAPPAPPARPTATAPVPRRPRRPLPGTPGRSDGAAARLRRRVLGFAVTIGLVALAANVVPLFLTEGSDDEVVVVTAATAVEWVTTSDGSITSATDPCSGASISGDLLATFSYTDDGFWATLEVVVVGTGLQGSDGSTYSLEVAGQGEGPSGTSQFVFESDRMVMTREDGSSFSDTATFTVGMAGDEVDTWSYQTVGPDCEG